ncbi:MAG: hypothetical protein Tsb009_26980 [Planctomycetaceae bacterium]
MKLIPGDQHTKHDDTANLGTAFLFRFPKGSAGFVPVNHPDVIQSQPPDAKLIFMIDP